MANVFGVIERIKNKWLRYYRRQVFFWYTKTKPEKLRILGPMTLINPNVKVGKNVTFYPNVMLFGDGPIVIGDNAELGNNCVIYAHHTGGIYIGANSMVAANCYIIDSNHGTAVSAPMREQPLETKAVEIGSDVWIAANCHVLKGAKIGSGAVIGAGSLVNKEIPENMIAFGTPAKPYKMRE